MKKIFFLFLVIVGLYGCGGGYLAQTTGHDVDGPYPGGFGVDIYNNTGTAMWTMYRGKEVPPMLGPGQGKRIDVGYYFNHTYTIVGKIRVGNTLCLAEKSVYVSGDYDRTPNIIFNQKDFFRCPRTK